MDLLMALVKFVAIMIIAGAAFMVIASYTTSIPWFKRTMKPADGDPNLMFAGSGSPDGEQGHQREATLKRKASGDIDGDLSGDSGGDGD